MAKGTWPTSGRCPRTGGGVTTRDAAVSCYFAYGGRRACELTTRNGLIDTTPIATRLRYDSIMRHRGMISGTDHLTVRRGIRVGQNIDHAPRSLWLPFEFWMFKHA